MFSPNRSSNNNNNNSVWTTPSPRQGLRFPKGFSKSPRNNVNNNKDDILYRILFSRKRFHVLVYVWLMLFPVAWIVLQWNLSDNNNNKNHNSDSNNDIIDTTSLSSSIHPYMRSVSAQQRENVKVNSKSSFDDEDIYSQEVLHEPDKAPLSTELITLNDFDPLTNPVFTKDIYTPKSSNPVQVLYIGTYHNDDDILLDALERSKYIKLCATFRYEYNKPLEEELFFPFRINSSKQPTVVIVDWIYRDCHILQKIFKYINKHNNILQYTYVLLLDSTASTTIIDCKEQLHTIYPNTVDDHIRVAKRSIVQDRKWNYETKWIDFTNTGNNNNLLIESNDPIIHMTGYVSNEFVDILQKVEAKVPVEKPVQVSHYWKSTTTKDLRYPYHYNKFRQTISQYINETHTNMDNSETWVDKLGLNNKKNSNDEDNNNNNENNDEDDDDPTFHIALLASSKIVVIAQNDEWEDHDNLLMEALASGALVMIDKMIAPPSGLKNKTNVIFYDSMESLQNLIQYYLDNDDIRATIGRHGREYALGRHRSWHVIESILFGKALTQTDKTPLTIEPPKKRKRPKKSTKAHVDL